MGIRLTQLSIGLKVEAELGKKKKTYEALDSSRVKPKWWGRVGWGVGHTFGIKYFLGPIV